MSPSDNPHPLCLVPVDPSVTDFLFFSGVLIYQMVVRQGQQPASPRERASIMGQDTLIPVSWWINIPGIKLEDIIFSMVLDLLGVIGEGQLQQGGTAAAGRDQPCRSIRTTATCLEPAETCCHGALLSG